MSDTNTKPSKSSGLERPVSLGRPSLIADLRREVVVPAAARWTVGDTSLRPVPPFYPPLNPRCSVYVGDAMPSVVALRISECLRKRSIAAEFDDESHMATCMTIDRVHFAIHLYRGEFRSKDDHDSGPDLASHGVIVECLRVRGDTISFHYHCRAILRAASGLSDGTDTRRTRSPLEVPGPARPILPLKRKAVTSTGLTALEDALTLLRKDRICAQRLGLERIVMLTDETTSGKDMAVYCSLVVLGAWSSQSTEAANWWILSLLRDRFAPGETIETNLDSGNTSLLDESTASSVDTARPVLEDAHHGGILRSLAMRAFANALSVLNKYEDQTLQTLLSNESPLVAVDFLAALVEDLAGAARPPAAVAGTRLASPHEAALAATCLRILAGHSETATKRLVPPKDERQPVLDALDKARNAGLSTNSMLVQESERAYALLSKHAQPF